MCFTSGCHWEGPSPSKVCGIYLCTSVAPSWHCTGKHCIWEYTMCQAMIMKVTIICSESFWKWRVEHSPNPSLHCVLYSLLSFFRGNTRLFSQDNRLYWLFYDHVYQHYADLDLGLKCSCKIIHIHNISSIVSQWVALTNTCPLVAVAGILIWSWWSSIQVSLSEYSLIDGSQGGSSAVRWSFGIL